MADKENEMKLLKHHKEYIRYLIVVIIMFLNYDLTIKAYELEEAQKLTMQFAGIVASSYAVLTMVLGHIFNTKVEE